VQPAPEDSKVDAEMRDAFKKISGEDMEIDAYELQDILNAAFTKGIHSLTVLCSRWWRGHTDESVHDEEWKNNNEFIVSNWNTSAK